MVPKRLPGIVRSSPLAFYAAAYTASAVIQKGLGFICFLWLARSLTTDEYAHFGLLYALQTALSTFAVAGIIEVVIGLYKGSEVDRKKMELFQAANSAFILLTFISTIVSGISYTIVIDSRQCSFINFTSVAISGILTAFVTLQSSLVRLEERHVTSVMFGFLPAIIGMIGGALLFLRTHSVSGFFIGSAGGMLISMLPFAVYRIRFLRPGPRVAVASILKRIAPFILIAVFGWLSGYGNTYPVKYFFTPRDVAKFTFVYSLSAIMQLVATSMNQAWSPRFFAIVHEMAAQEVEFKNKRFSIFQGLMLGMSGAGLMIILPWAIGRIGGNLANFGNPNRELFFLLSAYAVSVPWWHAQNYFYAYNKGKELMEVTILSSCTGFILWGGCVYLLGVIGVYVGFMVQFAVRTIVGVYCARKEWSIQVAWEGTTTAVILLLAGLSLSGFLYRGL